MTRYAIKSKYVDVYLESVIHDCYEWSKDLKRAKTFEFMTEAVLFAEANAVSYYEVIPVKTEEKK